MKEGAMLKWGIDDLSEMESWGCDIKVIEDLPMFRQHRKTDRTKMAVVRSPRRGGLGLGVGI